MNVLVRLLAWVLAIALVALPVVAVLNGWIAGDRWPLRRLEVTGPFQRVSAEQVRVAVLPRIENGFFAIRMDPIRDAVAALPWVERVEVRKRWPDQLLINLTEHRPFARWGHDKLLSEHGRLFAAPGSPDLQGLPELDGPPERVADVIALYNQAQQLFVGSGQRVQGVTVSDRGSWTLRLRDGTEVIVGRSDPQARLGRFAHLLPQLADARPGQSLQRADLRYTNGFALTWRDSGLGTRDSGFEGQQQHVLKTDQRISPDEIAHGWPRAASHHDDLPPSPESRAPSPGFTQEKT